MSGNPYRGLPDPQFWARAMTAVAPGQVDPAWGIAERIAPHHRVATMGSCFSQRLGREIGRLGLRYFVAETAPPHLSPEEARDRQYGVFSARYGNVYSPRQAVQLFDRAFGHFHPFEDVWELEGRFIDAFRPSVEPGGWGSPEEVRAAAQDHLAHVRTVFTDCDWLVLTLGMTEAWVSRIDGSVYPVAPGVAGGSFDPRRHAFANADFAEVHSALEDLVQRLDSVNPGARLLLTVSPVPIIATQEPRQVWTSNTVSKSLLRVAADQITREFPHVAYFPGYEVVTSPAAGGRYYADDLRQVTEAGLRHVMRLFRRHFVADGERETRAAVHDGAPLALPADGDVVCDEELIAASLRGIGGA
jgi:hypothetical protein